MNRMRALAILVAVLLAATGLSACGSSSDVSGLSTTKLLAKAKTAVKKEKYVSLKGTIKQSTNETGIDLNYIAKDSHGTITVQGAGMELETVAGKTYFKPSDEFWKAQMASSASAIIKLINGRWIVADPSNSSFKQIVDIAARSFVTDQILDPAGKVKKGKEKKVNGIDCIALTTSDGTLYLDKSDGKPVQIVGTGKEASGKADFTYDKIPAPKAPSKAQTVDLSQLGG
jgi:hypothetical protein